MEFDYFERRKIRMEDVKDFKVEAKVFDERTLFAIYRLMMKKVIKSVESKVKEGKESVILSGLDPQDNWVAIKVYRILHCDFKNMWKYLIADPRFSRVKKKRRDVVLTWVKREFKNLKLAFEGNVSCPKPLAIYENVMVMSFIGGNGDPAPKLVEVELDDWERVYWEVVEEIRKLLRVGLIHGDLSAFNILFFEKPYLIDFSQGVKLDHPLALEFLKRDIDNLNKFFKKLGVRVNESLFEELKGEFGLG